MIKLLLNFITLESYNDKLLALAILPQKIKKKTLITDIYLVPDL